MLSLAPAFSLYTVPSPIVAIRLNIPGDEDVEETTISQYQSVAFDARVGGLSSSEVHRVILVLIKSKAVLSKPKN